jgi:hypothetical protein
MMNKLIAMFLISFAFICASVTVYAGEKIDKSLEVDADGFVEIHNVRGEIDIIGWSNNEVKVTGTLDDMTEKFVFTTENGHTLIKVKLPRHASHRSRSGSELKIMVPQSSKVSFSGVATDVSFKNIGNGVEVNSVSGEIDISEIKGRVYINSVSGDIQLMSLLGNLEVSTVSGGLKASVDCENVTVSAVSADINLSLNQIKSARLSTVSGDVKVSGTLLNDGELKLGSVSGDAFYHTNDSLNAQIAMETAPGGSIINQYSEDKPKSTFINSHNLRFTAGDGNGVIRMSTVSGKIGIKRD